MDNDKILVYRGSGSDLATDIKGVLSPDELERLIESLPSPSQGPAAPHFEANGILLCKNCGGFRADHKPNEAGEPHYCRLEGENPLTGEWRYNMGYLCCGTLRIFRADFDTPPSEEFKAKLTGWMVKTLNAAQADPHPVPAAPAAPVGLSVAQAEDLIMALRSVARKSQAGLCWCPPRKPNVMHTVTCQNTRHTLALAEEFMAAHPGSASTGPTEGKAE
jgi:hypothetical protein